MARLERELEDALRQQTATAEILKVISTSTFDLQTVLDRLVETARHLCGADATNIWRPDGNVLKLAASYGHTREFKEFAQQNPITPGRGTVTGRVFLERKTIHIPDVLADKEFTGTGYQSRGRYRSHLGVPMLREGEAIGVFALTRSDVTQYSAKQIELLEDLRQPGGHRHRERPAARGREGTHARAARVAVAAAARTAKQADER